MIKIFVFCIKSIKDNFHIKISNDITSIKSSMYTGIGLDRLEASFGFEELFFIGAIWVDGHFLAMRFSNAENLLILQVHIHILLVESISLRNEADQLMQGYGNERQVL